MQDYFNSIMGKVIDTDGTPKNNPFQCVDIIKDGMNKRFGVPLGSYGDAIDYWYRTAQAVLNKFDKIKTTDVRSGDIVVLETNTTPIKPDTGDGHIGWATGAQNATQFEMVEQNGSTGNGKGKGNDVVRTRWISKSRIAGVLRAKQAGHYEAVDGAGINWFIRNDPNVSSSIVGAVRRGDVYQTEVLTNGWRRLIDKGGYVGPAAWR